MSSSQSTNSEGSAQRLHALGRANSLELARRLGRAQRQLGTAGDAVSAARTKYAQAADEYRAAWADAQRLFTDEQLTAEGFRPPPPRRPARRPQQPTGTREPASPPTPG